MCLSPVILKNPNYGIKRLSKVKDIHSTKIVVPCGTCAACASMRQTDFVERCQLMSLTHDFYFGTLTYNKQSLPHTRVFEHIDGSKRWYDYADVRDFRLMMKRIRKTYFHNRVDVKYLAVTEYGGQFHRPHFHFLFAVPRKEFQYEDLEGQIHTYSPSDSNIYNINTFECIFFNIFLTEWRRNISKSTKYPVWQRLCTYIIDSRGRSTYDFHYVKPLTKDGKRSSSVAKYVTKYILKYDSWLLKVKHGIYNNLEHDDYKELWKYLRPRVLCSLFFGVKEKDFLKGIIRPIMIESSLNHVREGIDWSKKDPRTNQGYPAFFDIETGKTMPLGRYLRHHFINSDDDLTFVNFRKILEGLSPDDDFFALDRYTKEIEAGNPEYFEKNISRYKNIHLYLERCNNSDTIYFYDG